MDRDETLLGLIGGVYDCALDPDNWNAVDQEQKEETL
jgi:hypothetical protein